MTFIPYNIIIYLTDTCYIIHVVGDVFGSLDDFIFRQHRVHDVHDSRTHVICQLVDGLIVLVEQRDCKTKHTKRFFYHFYFYFCIFLSQSVGHDRRESPTAGKLTDFHDFAGLDNRCRCNFAAGCGCHRGHQEQRSNGDGRIIVRHFLCKSRKRTEMKNTFFLLHSSERARDTRDDNFRRPSRHARTHSHTYVHTHLHARTHTRNHTYYLSHTHTHTRTQARVYFLFIRCTQVLTIFGHRSNGHAHCCAVKFRFKIMSIHRALNYCFIGI